MREIKDAGMDDIPLIRELAHATWPAAYEKIIGKLQLNYMLELIYSETALTSQIQSGHRFIIVYDDSNPVGFASFSAKDPANQQTFRLHKLYVLPSQQGKGTGKYLVNFIIAEARKDAATKLELNVNRNNAAYHFYTGMGFYVVAEADIDIGQGYFMNDYIMELAL